MEPLLAGKKIIIMGGTSGIGLAAALAFREQGAQVVVVGHEADGCEAARQRLGSDDIVLQGDARREATGGRAVEHCVELFGAVDGLYHVAGGSGRRWGDGPLHECTLDGWNRTLELNLTSVMLSNRAVLRYWLKTERGGSILNLGSVLGVSPAPQHFATHAYAAAKSALIGYSRSLAAYYGPSDIRVNVLLPALTETPMAERALHKPEIMAFVRHKQALDGGRAAHPGDLTGAAAYFLSDQARFTTGQVLAVDGGWMVRG